MIKFYNKSLGSRFTVILTVVMSCFFLIFSSIITVRNISSMRSQLDKRATELSSLAQSSLSSALWQYNHSNINDFVEALFIYEDLVFIKAITDDNNPIKTKIRPKYQSSSFSDFENSPDFISNTISITYNESYAGKIQVVISRKAIYDTIITNTQTSILGLLGLTIVIYVTVLLITKRFVINQILLLKDSTDEIASGNLDAVIDTNGNDEIGELAKSFDSMRNSIKDSIEKIKKADELAKVNIRLEDALDEAQSFRDALDKVPSHVFIKNLASRYIYCNQLTLDLFGCSAEELVGCDDNSFFPPDTVKHLRKIDSRVFAGETTKEEIEVVDEKSGNVFYLEVKTPIYEEPGSKKITGLLGIATDITERKKAEKELRKYRDHLEELVNERTSELERKNSDLEAAIKESEMFSYSISHDLKAPLRAIAGFSNILMLDHKDSLDEEGMRLLNVVQTNVLNMGELIEDILMYSRMGRQALKKTSIGLNKIAETIATKLILEAPNRAIHFNIAPLPSCMGDKVLMTQVLTNLLTNAVKFTGKQEVAEIEIGCIEKNGKPIYYIRDNGEGFDMKYADKLFGLFQRLHSPKEFEGTGVGLAIVQRLIQRHGGRVWAEGKVGEGATFYFTLGEK